MASERSYAVTELYYQSQQTDVVATPGGGQANAKQVFTRGIIHITSVATIADSVMLPIARAGSEVKVINRGGASVQLFGQLGDKINDVASATGVAQANNTVGLYVCPKDGLWYGGVLT